MTELDWIELFQDFWDDGYFAGLEAGIRDKTKWSPEVGRELYDKILTAGGTLPTESVESID